MSERNDHLTGKGLGSVREISIQVFVKLNPVKRVCVCLGWGGGGGGGGVEGEKNINWSS